MGMAKARCIDHKALHILCHMGGDGSADGMPGNLFIPQAMPWGKA